MSPIATLLSRMGDFEEAALWSWVNDRNPRFLQTMISECATSQPDLDQFLIRLV